jgi:hypothetical protein
VLLLVLLKRILINNLCPSSDIKMTKSAVAWRVGEGSPPYRRETNFLMKGYEEVGGKY